jgi:hypothetical protein
MSKQRLNSRRKRAQGKRRAQNNPAPTKTAPQRLRFGSLGVRSNLGEPPPLSDCAAQRLYARGTEAQSSEDDEVRLAKS